MALFNINIDYPDDISEEDKTLIEQRVKIDVRTWMLRFSLGALFFSLSVNVTLLITLLTLLL